ncbi:MAG: sigma-70 family RNA polymerase sigma factor [Bacteroidota bacterium]
MKNQADIEASWIEGIQKGDRESQRKLYDSYLPFILSIVRRFGFHDSDIADVIQEIFIEVFINLKKYDAKKGALKYWIKSLAIHKILNTIRKNKRKTLIQYGEPIQEPGIRPIALEELDAEYLIDCIATLPDGYRTVFNLYAVDGYSHQEIGQMLGIGANSSRSQLSRAKQLLKKKLYKLKPEIYDGLLRK